MSETMDDLETAPAASSSTAGAISTAKRVRWSGAEEAALIETALQNNDVLFGCLKGVATKGISRRRTECWSAVASTLNG